MLHAAFGKCSFPTEHLYANLGALTAAVLASRPKGVKGGGAPPRCASLAPQALNLLGLVLWQFLLYGSNTVCLTHSQPAGLMILCLDLMAAVWKVSQHAARPPPIQRHALCDPIALCPPMQA